MAIPYKDYYKILGVERQATEAEIKAAYRKAARKHHPDLHAKHDKAAAEEQFKSINEAYAVLGDQEKRAQYDQLGPDGVGGFGGFGGPGGPGRPAGPAWQSSSAWGDDRGPAWNEADSEGFSDFFASLFGRQNTGGVPGGFRPARNMRGQDLVSEIELTMEEAYHGGQKSIQISAHAPCPDCGGTGSSGQKICKRCAGAGSKPIVRTLDFKIPAAVRDGSKIRLKGQGGEGSAGGLPGDLLLTVKIQPHGCLTLNGNTLETTVRIRPEQAVLGCRISVPTLDGDVMLTVPPMMRNGKKLRLRGKGWPDKSGKPGDEHVSIIIDLPRSLTPAEVKLYQQLADLRNDDH